MCENPTSRSQLTVIVPIFNEASHLPTFLPQLIDHCMARNWRMILVDDGSTDESPQILSGYKGHPSVNIQHHKVNHGYGGALRTGIIHADTEYIVTIDADGQHDLDDLDRLLDVAEEKKADLVIGNRGKQPHTSFYRAAGKWLIRKFAGLLVPLPIKDLNSGFKLYRAELAKKYITACPDSMAFSDVMTLIFLHQRDLVFEIPVTVHARKSGTSTITTYTAFETIIEILNIVMMFNPQRIFLPLSALSILFGLSWGARFLILGRGMSVGSMLAIVTGLLFFFMGLIAGQLSAIRMEQIHRSSDPMADGKPHEP